MEIGGVIGRSRHRRHSVETFGNLRGTRLHADGFPSP